jgi:hypothetical protein
LANGGGLVPHHLMLWVCCPHGEVGMDAWWWVPIGLAAWFGVSLMVGLLLGPILKQAREAPDAQPGRHQAGRQRPPQDGPRAA